MRHIIESVTEGVTSEFYWYELSLAKAKLQEVQIALDKVIKTIETREKEQAEYVVYLKQSIDKLRVEINTLRKD